MFILKVSLVLLMVHQYECRMTAIAVMYGDNSTTSYGVLTFTQDDANSPVRITGTLTGLYSNNAHGFHVHVDPVSDGSPNCNAAGLHFNPYNASHGPRLTDIKNRHVGDLGNLTTNSFGSVTIDIYDSIIQLYNITQSIYNRTAIVHRFRDDGGQGGFSDSSTTGNAGGRMFCGLIKSNGFNIKSSLLLLLIMIIISMKLF